MTRSRIFGARDKTLKGQSKEGWRHVELEADDVFMKILENFTENHRFKLGSDGIQLWGGRRKKDGAGQGKGKSGEGQQNVSKNSQIRGARPRGNGRDSGSKDTGGGQAGNSSARPVHPPEAATSGGSNPKETPP